MEVEIFSRFKALIRWPQGADALDSEDSEFYVVVVPPDDVEPVVLIPELVRIKAVVAACSRFGGLYSNSRVKWFLMP